MKKRWEPSRIPTPRFIDDWNCNESDGPDEMVPALFGHNCENVVVCKLGELDGSARSELFVDNKEISFCRVYAKSGSGREDKVSSDINPPSSSENEYAE